MVSHLSGQFLEHQSRIWLPARDRIDTDRMDNNKLIIHSTHTTSRWFI